MFGHLNLNLNNLYAFIQKENALQIPKLPNMHYICKMCIKGKKILSLIPKDQRNSKLNPKQNLWTF